MDRDRVASIVVRDVSIETLYVLVGHILKLNAMPFATLFLIPSSSHIYSVMDVFIPEWK